MKYYLPWMLLATLLWSCEATNEPALSPTDATSVVFGQFYGLCVGEQCVEIFRIDDTGLYEDRNDIYPNRMDFYEGDFELLNADLGAFHDLRLSYPNELFDEEQTVFGCPDCADQGGYYLEISLEDGTRRMWIFDTAKDEIPEYVHTYIDLIQQKISDIND